MRLRPVPRFILALLAFVTGLSSPVTAIAHGVAHAHEAHAVAHVAMSTMAATEAACDAADSHSDDEHAILHARCTAVVHLVAAALPPAPASLPEAAQVRRVRVGLQPSLGVPTPTRASPPDQPRAPPLG